VATVPGLIPGDANFDGKVNKADAAILGQCWGRTGATWIMGDFNRDGRVGAADAAILTANWGYDASETTGVPEPTLYILYILLAGATLLCQLGRSIRLASHCGGKKQRKPAALDIHWLQSGGPWSRTLYPPGRTPDLEVDRRLP